MGRISLKIKFYEVDYLRKKSDWRLKNKEAISLDEDQQEHTNTLWFHYYINNRPVKESIAEGYSAIYRKLNEFLQDLEEEQNEQSS